jgi:hypothetical protein
MVAIGAGGAFIDVTLVQTVINVDGDADQEYLMDVESWFAFFA